ncbi:MAG TPA: hypothetical protein VMI74_15565 [Burkholderiales bacterium]|nr:hypothetical protein [Burkholderiales bacterium]
MQHELLKLIPFARRSLESLNLLLQLPELDFLELAFHVGRSPGDGLRHSGYPSVGDRSRERASEILKTHRGAKGACRAPSLTRRLYLAGRGGVGQHPVLFNTLELVQCGLLRTDRAGGRSAGEDD